MKCPSCNNHNLRVSKSKYDKRGVYIRHRKCIDCGYETTTAEVKYIAYEGFYSFTEAMKGLIKSL